ncbi:MAG: hypothetical protein H6Q86_1264 [candidate division NC10 bacterium]|nr:hypothetical protein [candidate division NC10 bacterium]
MSQTARKRRKGFTLIELLIGIAIVSLLAMIAIPNVMKANRKARYGRAAADAKTATTSAVTYALDKNVYPTSLAVLRANGYGSVDDLDPWKIPFELCPALLGGGPALSGQDIYVIRFHQTRVPAVPRATPPSTAPGRVSEAAVNRRNSEFPPEDGSSDLFGLFRSAVLRAVYPLLPSRTQGRSISRQIIARCSPPSTMTMLPVM